MDVRETLRQAVEMGASDIFIIAGLPLTYKVDGRQRRMETRLMPADTAAVISDIYALCGRSRSRIEREDMDDDFSFSIPDLGRFRANVLHQRGSLAAVIRVIRFGLPEPEKLNIRARRAAANPQRWPASSTPSTRQEKGTSSRWKTPLNTSIGMTGVS